MIEKRGQHEIEKMKEVVDKKKKKGKKKEKNRNSQAHSGGCSSAEKNRNSLEVLSTHLKLSKKEVKEVEWSFDL